MGRDSPREAEVLARPLECLLRLLPHLSAGGFAITGSLAMYLHGVQHRQILDVDVVAGQLDVVHPSVAATFLISHYHLPTIDSPKFMVQLVDPQSRLRVDIFPDLEGSIARATAHMLDGLSTPIVSEADILRHKLQTLRGATRERPVDPKHLEDVRALASRVGKVGPAVASLLLRPDEFATDTARDCVRCRESQSLAFPLAPKQEVLKLLGYV